MMQCSVLYIIADQLRIGQKTTTLANVADIISYLSGDCLD